MRTQLLSRLMLGAALALGVVGPGCKDGGISVAERPDISISPGQLVFNPLPLGQSSSQNLRIENSGKGTAVISNIRVVNPDGADGLFEIEGFDVSEIKPGERITVKVTYTAVVEGRREGSLRFDAAGDPLQVDFEVVEPQGIIIVTPNPVNFGRVTATNSRTLDVDICNRGNSPANLKGFSLLGTPEFSIPAEYLIPEGQPVTLAIADDESTLEVNERCYSFEMTYTPQTDDPDTAELYVDSDASNERVVVRVEANGAEPCLDISTSSGPIDLSEPRFDFGRRFVGRQHLEPFTVLNCADRVSGEVLRIESLALGDGSSAEFALPQADGLAFPLELQPGQSFVFPVQYTPSAVDVTAAGVLNVVSNDPYFGELPVALNGIGSDNASPHAVAKCTISGFSSPPTNEISAAPLDTLNCTASESYDEDGEVVDYLWRVVTRPPGSTAEFVPDNGVNAEFFVDFAGTYEVHLIVWDEDGAPSSDDLLEVEPVAIVTIVSVPDEDVHIELSWTTPGDPDETDTGFARGSDVDLHFIHPNGCWNDSLWDCHFRAIEPNWGNPAPAVEDDPSLDIDDTDGAGPENINVKNLENGTIYKIGVHYYDDHGFGASVALVKVYIRGVEVFAAYKDLPSTDFWWIPGAIQWPSGEIVVIDQTFTDVPACR